MNSTDRPKYFSAIMAGLFLFIALGAAPISVQKAFVTKSGSIAVFFTGATPLNPAYPTAVSSNPVISVNGAVVTCQGPFWSSVQHQLPWVAYQLPSAVKTTDVVTWTAQAGWVSASQGLAGADAGAIENYAGQLEPGVFNYPGFDDKTRTLQVGFNGPGDLNHQSCLTKNVMRRAFRSWLNATTATPDGYPLTIGPGFAGTTFTPIWSSGDNNGIDAKSMPTPMGTWTLLADESAPTTPMVPTVIVGGGLAANPGGLANNATLSAPTLTPGVLVNGVELGKRWDWQIVYAAAPTTWSPNINFAISTPGKVAGPNTLSNLRLFAPGDKAVTDPGLTTSDTIAEMLHAGSGVYAPVVRLMEATAGSDGGSSIVAPADLRSAADFSYQALPLRLATDWPINAPTFAGDRQIPVWAVRAYDLAVSPKVYLPQHYKRSVASTGAYPFEWSPAAFGLDYDWIFKPPAPNPGVVLEFVTGDASGNPIAHNLQSGQFLQLGAMPAVPVANTLGTGTATLGGGNNPIWVTGPNTFVGWYGSTLKAAPRFGTAVGTTTVNSLATFRVTNIGPAMPVEVVANVSRAAGNCALWIAVNHSLNDDGVKALAIRLYNATLRGTKIYVEYSNEILIPNPQYFFSIALASLEGLAQEQAVIQRTFEVQNIFAQVFGNDDIVRVFQPFVISQPQVKSALQYAQLNSIPIDVLAFASYPDMDISPTFAMAAAAICADDVRSIANVANGGSGVLMPMAGYQDLVRLYLRYNNVSNGPTGFAAQTYNTMVASMYGSGYGPSTFRHSLPRIVQYEANLTAAIPPGVSKTAKAMRAGLSHDFMYHPSFYDTTTAFLQFLQCPGPIGTPGNDMACIEGLIGLRQGGNQWAVTTDGADNGFVTMWASYTYQGQPRGLGLKNKYWATSLGGDGAAHDVDNEVPGARAYMDWILQADSRRRTK